MIAFQISKAKLRLLFFLCICCFCSYAQKNDTIILKNKDRIIGEIKEMHNGVLALETDYSDEDFKVKWIDIVKITSSHTFLITLSDGDRFNSTINTDTITEGNVIIEKGPEKISIPVKDIVYVKSIKSSFLSRLDASLSVGFNYTKSSSLRQLTVRSSFGYTANLWAANGSYNSVRSSQTDTDEIQRTDADIGFRYFLKDDYFLILSTEFLSNEEQKLSLRITTKGGVGKYFVHTNRLYFGGKIGVAWNNEKFTDTPDDVKNSAEAFAGLELNMFDVKDFSLLTNGNVYPSLTESKRVRADYKIDLKYDLPLDFFIKFGFTYNYDSKPVEGAAYDDYIFQTTFGWEL